MLIVRRYNGVMVLEVAWGREDADLAPGLLHCFASRKDRGWGVDVPASGHAYNDNSGLVVGPLFAFGQGDPTNTRRRAFLYFLGNYAWRCQL